LPDSTGLDAGSPLEAFLRDYAEAVGGVCDEVEPQVYDLMLPPAADGSEPEIVRVAFDPEAIPEHPGAQLASYGTPLVDRLLADALARGRRVDLYLTGLNLAPRGIEDRARRTLALPKGAELRVERIRPMHFPQAVFGFEATFIGDQKEQDVLSAAVDLHHGRQVRHLEALLDRSRLAEAPWEPLPEAPHPGLASAYPAARDRVIRTLAALANARGRELGDRLGRQLSRMARYYADLRAEVAGQADRAGGRGAADSAKFAARLEALDREERTRAAELRRKATLRVQLRLITLLVIRQPKLLLRSAVLEPAGSVAGRLDLVWDPLVDALEAVPCPRCGQPTFTLEITRQGALACPACPTPAPARPPRT
jgi:hypothetical protein